MSPVTLSDQSIVGGRAIRVLTDNDMIDIQHGGTGASTADQARVNLDAFGLHDTAPVVFGAPVFESGLESSTWIILDVDASVAGVEGIIFKDMTSTGTVRMKPATHPFAAGEVVLVFPTVGGRLGYWPVGGGAAGSIQYGSGAANPPFSTLSVGAEGKLLKSVGSAPAWSDAATVKVDLAAQAAAIGATNLITGASGQYLIAVIQTVTTTATGTLLTTIRSTDENGAQAATPAVGLSLLATGTDQGSVMVYAASGNITYETSLAGLIGVPGYSLHIAALKL